ncbi:XkdX family protein [Candidatus Saccharibacteria bacterium]|nr:XkdX family protein [Candidatus Saccharibacteria bacterium]
MFNRLKRLYDQGRLSQDGLQFYVDHGIITQEEYDEIVGVKATRSKTK